MICLVALRLAFVGVMENLCALVAPELFAYPQKTVFLAWAFFRRCVVRFVRAAQRL
jgi:hypothetical protein